MRRVAEQGQRTRHKAAQRFDNRKAERQTQGQDQNARIAAESMMVSVPMMVMRRVLMHVVYGLLPCIGCSVVMSVVRRRVFQRHVHRAKSFAAKCLFYSVSYGAAAYSRRLLQIHLALRSHAEREPAESLRGAWGYNAFPI